MLRSLTVSNYRSLGESVRIEFGRLTALVGPNGSGKSNVLDALRFVSDAMSMGLPGAVTFRNGIQSVRRWSGGGHPFDVNLELELELEGGTEGLYGFELRGDRDNEYAVSSEKLRLIHADGSQVGYEVDRGVWNGPDDLHPEVDEHSLVLPLVGGDKRLRKLLHALQSMSAYSIQPDTLRAPQRDNRRRPMERNGENWLSVLSGQDPDSWKPEMISALFKLTGDVEDVEIDAVGDYLVLRVKHRSRSPRMSWSDVGQESDGTLRVAGIITALLQEPAVPVIGIEEPELTVHPGAIDLLYDQLQQATDRSQVIITSHSPEMLDHFSVDDVRVVERRDGITTVRPMAEHQKNAVRNRLLSLGDLLRTEGIEQAEDERSDPQQQSIAVEP